MKVESIQILNMHKVKSKLVDIKDHVTYLHGPNGAGKSTILEAIQLALLGYIPGLGKTNSDIMRHAHGPILGVELKLKDGDTTVTVNRMWTAKKKSVTSGVEITPEGYTLDDIIKDIELPIFNFNEFLGLSANKLKDWFIKFLPTSSSELRWDTILPESLKDNGVIIENTEILDEYISSMSAYPMTVDGVSEANQYFKSALSFKKDEANRAQATINTLVYNDDVDDGWDEAELKNEMDMLYNQLAALNSQKAKQASQQSMVDALTMFSDLSESIDKDLKYAEIKSNLDKSTEELARIKTEYDPESLNSRVTELTFLIKEKQSILRGNGVCPYSHKKCQTIQNYLSSVSEEIEKFESEQKEILATLYDCNLKSNGLQSTINTLKNSLNDIETKYARRDAIKAGISGDVAFNPNIDEEIQQIKDSYDEVVDHYSKVKANNHYSAMIDTLTAQKFKVEQEIEALKVWAKITDANGLQTSMMEGRFREFEDELTPYIQKLYSKENVSARFNIESKANSFSFGLLVDEDYVPYDLLSSGEKCIYMFAIMTCIISKIDTPLKVILVDDALDHLDDSNIDALFKTLSSIDDVQYIIAGVKDCKSASKYKIEVN